MGKTAQVRDAQKSVNQETSPAHKTLVVGNIARWTAEGRAAVPHDDVRYYELDEVTEDTLNDLTPTIILSPLMGDNFDVLDIAARLNELGFQGQYRAITESIPDREMIRNEVKAHAPDLDFDLLMIPPTSDVR